MRLHAVVREKTHTSMESSFQGILPTPAQFEEKQVQHGTSINATNLLKTRERI